MSAVSRDAKVRSLCARLNDDRASESEIDVADALWARIEKGRESYGPMNLANDPREWSTEQCEELLDYLVYRRIADIVRVNERLERLRCDAADELAAMPVDRRLRNALIELRDSQPVIGGHR